MGRGTHRGFITYEELSKSLGKRNLSDENLAQAFIHILDEKVTLVEKKSDFKVLRKKDGSSKDEGKTIININLVDGDNTLKFKLKNARKLDRKSLNLLRKQQIQATIS